jgi:SAM-dependent methyltransferase
MQAIWARTRSWGNNSDTVRRWRERRYRLFVELCNLRPEDRILDLGAGEGAALARFNSTNEIVAVDVKFRKRKSEWLEQTNVTTIVADATELPFDDRSFDIVFSNSVIEHVPRDRQELFAEEVRRVGRRYFVQTPNRYFPIEPHYQLPLFQFVPERVRRSFNARIGSGYMPRGARSEITLLSARDLQKLFPDATIAREHLAGLTKSLMAVRGVDPAAAA